MNNTNALAADLARLRTLTGVKWTRYGADVIPSWVADMDLPTAPAIIDALSDLVERRDFGYHFSACASLPAAFSEWQAARHGWRPDSARVRVFCDVLQAVDLALWARTRPGDGVVLMTPVYPPFHAAITSIGRRIVECPLEPGSWRLDPERLEACIDDTTSAILFCSPHNPTGRVFAADELAAVAEVAERHDLLVISDEIWSDVVFEGTQHVPFASISDETAMRTITVSSASKPFNVAGLRCAVAHIGEDALEEQIAELPAHLLGAVGEPGALASLAAWTSCASWLDERVTFLASQRDHALTRIRAELPLAETPVPEATYLAWLDLRGYDLGDDPAAWLLEHAKVALGSGPDFGGNGAGFARLNFATTRPVLDEVLDRIVTALDR